MRGNTWQARALLGTMMLVFMGRSLPAQAPAGKPAAVVNGVAISQEELAAELKPLGPMPLEIPAEQKKLYQMQALNMMMDKILITQFLATNAPPVQPAELEAKFAEFVGVLRKEGKTVADICKEYNKTEEELRKELALPLQWAAYGLAHVTDADLQKYFVDNTDVFNGTMVRASHILIHVSRNAPEADKARVRAQLTELRNAILSRQIEFGDAAKKYSQCPTASKGGDLDFFPRRAEQIDENIAGAAFALKVGQVSDVVQTVFGLHLIMVTDRKEGKPTDFNQNKDFVRELYMRDMWMSVLAKLRLAAKIEVYLP